MAAAASLAAAPPTFRSLYFEETSSATCQSPAALWRSWIGLRPSGLVGLLGLQMVLPRFLSVPRPKVSFCFGLLSPLEQARCAG